MSVGVSNQEELAKAMRKIATWSEYRALYKANLLEAFIMDNAALLASRGYFDRLSNPRLSGYSAITSLAWIGAVIGLIGLFAGDGGEKVFAGLMLLGGIGVNFAIAPKANDLRRELLCNGAAIDFRIFLHLTDNGWLLYNIQDAPTAARHGFVACKDKGHVYHDSENECPACRVLLACTSKTKP